MRILVLLVVTGLLGPGTTWAEDLAAGEAAPALPDVAWSVPPEAPSLEGLRGRVLLLAFWKDADAARDSPWLDLWQETHWKKGIRVLLLARVDAAPLGTLVRQQAFAYPVGSAETLGPYAAAAEAGEAVLIAADGTVAWHGPIEEIDPALVAKLLRRVKLPKAEAASDAHDALDRLAGRSTDVGAAALAVDVYDRIETLFKGAPACEAAQAAEKELKRDKHAKKEIAAASSFFTIVAAWLRVGGSDRKKQDLGKRIDRFMEKHDGTRAASQARLLLTGLRGDAALLEMRRFIAEQAVDTGSSGWRTALNKPPKLTFTPGRSYFWLLETSEGPIRLRLYPDVAPMHVSSTIYLTELGYYDGLVFHRVIPGFMAQGGCPLGSGTGSPGYKYEGEFDRSVRHDRPGVLSMAHAGAGTDGSQFFITFKPKPGLDGKHSIFGEVVEGMGTVNKLEAQGSADGPTKKRLVIEKATIEVE